MRGEGNERRGEIGPTGTNRRGEGNEGRRE